MKQIAEILAPQSAFSSGYQDNRWRDRAKEFRRRQGNFCRSCKRGDVPISVRHANFTPGKELWEHDDSELVALCEPCHLQIAKTVKVFRHMAANSNAPNISAIVGLLVRMIQKDGDREAMLKIARIAQ